MQGSCQAGLCLPSQYTVTEGVKEEFSLRALCTSVQNATTVEKSMRGIQGVFDQPHSLSRQLLLLAVKWQLRGRNVSMKMGPCCDFA